ncbi:kunitz-type serine protease inhibitor A-like [Dermacentor silvarum]|uniref:kunitz-type serine protease inhibitor A-like n=1 Tax=Dermacentor silvarum TaxID=543639 RepID=UPI0021015F18|nr:kunitz-type serine protease inhibitor A-like [Dermacentor silvarum]
MSCEARTFVLIMLPLLCYFEGIIGIPKGCLIRPRTKSSGMPLPRWYYNATSHKCQPVMWGGHGYSGNVFKSSAQCEKTCGSLYRPEADVCLLTPAIATCNHPGPSVLMWTYNSKTMTCVSVQYHGCNGGKNLYRTCKMCRSTCIHHTSVLQFCPENPPTRKLVGNHPHPAPAVPPKKPKH